MLLWVIYHNLPKNKIARLFDISKNILYFTPVIFSIPIIFFMKVKVTSITVLFLLYAFGAFAQCTTTDATGCSCKDGTSNCDLLPDITVSAFALQNYKGGPDEHSQSEALPDKGRLYVTSSTPNIGYGSLTVGSVSLWVCGTDTLSTYPGATCPNGNPPAQLVKQKIYHKNGNTMTYTERWAGSMTYHPTHGHMHVDDWTVMTLRKEDPNDPNPLNWPIVGTGSKLGFCLMDYGSCNYYNGHCRDSVGNILTQPNFPNYELGGGGYNCSPVEQGISSGYTDIYDEDLNGMWIDILPGTCNGLYYIVLQADPHNVFLEERDDNNMAMMPFMLTKQVPSASDAAHIMYAGNTHLCGNETATLSAPQDASFTYLWSNGATTPSINVTNSGIYTVEITSQCGIAQSDSVVLNFESAVGPSVANVALCESGTATLSTSGNNVTWYNAPTGGTVVGTGNSFTTPVLSTTTHYYAEDQTIIPGINVHGGPLDETIGTGSINTSNTRFLIFDVLQPATLVSVWVDASTAGDRTVELRDNTGAAVQSATINIPQGQNRITLNFPLTPGTNYELGLSSSSAVNLYRNNSGVVYPYNIGGMVDITGSSAGSAYYYFYYDWEIVNSDKTCTTPRTDAMVTVSNLPTVTLSGLQATYMTSAAPVTLSGTPVGGTFSGPGVTGNTFSPAAAGAGGPYYIVYKIAEGSCTKSDTISVTVTYGVSIDETGNVSNLAVYPNPNQGSFTLKFEVAQAQPLEITLFNVAGQTILTEKTNNFSGAYLKNIQIANQASGMYFLEIKAGNAVYRTKIVKE